MRRRCAAADRGRPVDLGARALSGQYGWGGVPSVQVVRLAASAQFKRLAAELPFEDTGAYANLKDPVCDLVYLPAEVSRLVKKRRRSL